MDSSLADRPVLEWDPADVHNWLSSIGYPHWENQLKEHTVDGEALTLLNPESLKELGVSTIGQRLAILKAVYLLKTAHNIPIGEDHYVPPSEAPERPENLTIEKLHSVVQEQANRLRTLEDDNRHLSQLVSSFADDVNSIKSSLGRSDELSSLRRQPSFKWAQFVKPQKSPTKQDSVESPHPSPQRQEHDIAPYTRQSSQTTFPSTQPPSTSDKQRQNSQPASVTDSPNPNQTSLKSQRQESSDNLKSFKVSLEDPTWKVLPAALKKYRINNDTWKNYAMFICYGSSGNRIERCLSYDEKPLLLFQKLKDSKKNPVFMLKHIKDIRSPIAVAQQKHAARKASSIISNDTVATQGHYKAASSSRTNHRPPRLEVSDLSTASGPLSTALTPQPGWPEPGTPSPFGDQQKGDDTAITPASAVSRSAISSMSSEATLTVPINPPKLESKSTDSQHTNSLVSIPGSSSGVSYAVAIYPYMAEQDDEFDVVVGDTFVILSRSRGWWIVQRDPTGSGVVDTDIVKQGWVPAGCLLETNVPVASAIAEATAAKGSSGSGDASKTPILPLSIISTSFPGIALMDYKKKGDEELDLLEGDQLRVFKRYNHWSYAVKEQGGDRGWVPSWFIGKVSNHTGGTPNTPGSSTIQNPSGSTPNFDDITQAQVSPMSSAFPVVQTRS